MSLDISNLHLTLQYAFQFGIYSWLVSDEHDLKFILVALHCSGAITKDRLFYQSLNEWPMKLYGRQSHQLHLSNCLLTSFAHGNSQ